ncbi:MAG: restriction endonuclease, partial [Cyanobacteriota bacterium]|nr:restriction endonuclease [Cyanobacteriota bacterium]
SEKMSDASHAAANAGNTLAQSTKKVKEVIVDAGDTMTQSAIQASQSVSNTSDKIVQSVARASQTIGSTTMQLPKGLGSAVNLIHQSSALQKLTKNLKVDWLVRAIDAIDIAKADAEVRALQQAYPDRKANEIAHQFMLEKALLAAGMGLTSSLVPGTALALAGVDFAATTALAAELIYQIAAAYGMDLQSSDRKGEALAIFGLSLGGRLAIEAGLGLVSNVPFAGALINASASAAMIYTLGYGACRFYEAHLNASEIDTKLGVLQDVLKVESEQYLETAIGQEIVMDWLFVHVLRAGSPETTWEQLLPELQTAHLSPNSLKEISENIQSPPSVEKLLEQLDRDFATVLLERCKIVAESDNKITPEEDRLLQLIAEKVSLKAERGGVEGIESKRVEARNKTSFDRSSANLGTVLLETFKKIVIDRPELDAQEVGYLVDRVDRMTGEEFEDFLGMCFQKLGYHVETTPKTGDFGADLILTKGGEKTIVQAKRYQNKVGTSSVQEIVGAIKYYHAQKAIVITNNQFTSSARELARSNEVELWEREQLIDLIVQAKNRG